MSSRRSTSSSAGPSANGDVVMGPPVTPSSSSTSKDTRDEKLRTLKRTHGELEEKIKEAGTEVEKSGPRIVRMREHRNDLENDGSFNNSGSTSSPSPPQPNSSTYPRSLSNSRISIPASNFTTIEDGLHDPPSTRYVGSDTRTRLDDEPHHGEDTRESRDAGRSGRSTLQQLVNGQGTVSPDHRSPTTNVAQNSSSSASSSSLHAHPQHSPTSTHSHQPIPQPRIDDHSPLPHQHSSGPERHDTRASPKDLDVDMTDYDEMQQPNGAHSGNSKNDHDYADHDKEHYSNGAAEPNGQPQSVSPASRKPETTPGPSRNTRRSTRIAAADNTGRESEKERVVTRTRAGKRKVSTSPIVSTRTTRRESTTHAAAVPTAGTEHTSRSITSDTTPAQSNPAPPGQLYATSPISPVVHGHNNSSAQIAVQTSASDANIDPALVGTSSEGSKQAENGSTKRPSPMDNIVKVAEAAIAAQNAANAAQNTSTAPSSSALPSTSQMTTSGSTGTSGSSTYNPYMITTLMVPNKNNTGAASPSGMMPLSMNPYAMYYPPGTPVTPGTPPYPYGNPYYYLTGPMPSPGGVYPPNANFVPPGAPRPPTEVQRQAKPKRLKAHTVTSKSFSIPMVPRDKRGNPMLPLNVGIMTVISLGEVCMREHFHTERYIFPVGYEVTRRYLSTVDPNIEVVYHCTILDGGDGPKFQIVPSDVPDRPVIAGTATGAWSSIVKQANAIRNRQHSNSVSGPDFFGLGQNTIKHLIQELPNADRLRDYVWQTFVEGGPLGGRHAAVIPALPEEYDASMPIGAYYPTDRDKRKRDAAGTANAPSPKGLAHYPQHIVAQAEAQRAAALQQLNPGEPSGSQQLLDSQGAPPAPSGTPNFQEYRPQLATSGDKAASSPAGSGASTPAVSSNLLSSAAGSAPVPATFASIMNAYPTSAASSVPTLTQ